MACMRTLSYGMHVKSTKILVLCSQLSTALYGPLGIGAGQQLPAVPVFPHDTPRAAVLFEREPVGLEPTELDRLA